MSLLAESWPSVPLKDRPKPFYVRVNLDSEDSKSLEDKGWEVVDVRLLPCDSDVDRQTAVKATLTGSRMGTIELTKLELDTLELEARACGMVGNKVAAEKPVSSVTKDALELILDRPLSTKAFQGLANQNKPNWAPNLTKPAKKKKK